MFDDPVPPAAELDAPSGLVDRLRAVVPQGTLPIAIGFLVAGVTAYGFLLISGRVLGPASYASLSALWFVGFLSGAGFLQPLEQELASALAARRAAGLGAGPLVRLAARTGAAVALALGLLTLALHRPLLDRLFDDDVLLVAALGIMVGGYAFEHFSRGILAADATFRPYGFLLGAEGGLRLLGCIGLAVAGVVRPGAFGLVVALAPWLATAFTVPAYRHVVAEPGPPAQWRELSTRLAVLVAASVFGQALSNAAPLAAKVLGEELDPVVVGAFQAGVVLTRSPAFLFAAVQASLLPALARLAAVGEMAEFWARLRRILGAVAAATVVATAGSWLAGRFLLQFLFGDDFDLGGDHLALLALGSCLHMGGLALSQALIALGRHGRVALGWGAGVAVFLAALPVLGAGSGDDVLRTVELAFVVGEATMLAVLATSVRSPLTGAQSSTSASKGQGSTSA